MSAAAWDRSHLVCHWLWTSPSKCTIAIRASMRLVEPQSVRRLRHGALMGWQQQTKVLGPPRRANDLQLYGSPEIITNNSEQATRGGAIVIAPPLLSAGRLLPDD